MRRPRAPLYLGRAAYRRRRLHDAARLLPLFGLFLIGLPMLWAPDATGVPHPAARDVVWLFAVWAGLIATSAILAPGLGAGATAHDGNADAAPPPDGSAPVSDRPASIDHTAQGTAPIGEGAPSEPTHDFAPPPSHPAAEPGGTAAVSRPAGLALSGPGNGSSGTGG